MPTNAELREDEVAIVRDIVTRRCGFYLGEPHAGYLGRRISDRVNELGLSFADYVKRLNDSPTSGGELQALVERLCIYETRFMRDPPDFRALACFILPQLAREMRRSGRRRLRVVSAGSSSGQEAYTIAMILDEAKAELGDAQMEVIGLDLSTEAIEKARRGVYSRKDVSVLDPWRQQRYFQPCGDDLEIVPWLKERVRFLQANLTRDLPVTQVEVIFCRNVLIYFNHEQRYAVVRSLLAALRLGGYLIVGSADSMWAHRDVLQAMRTSGTVVFRRARPMPVEPSTAVRPGGAASAPIEPRGI